MVVDGLSAYTHSSQRRRPSLQRWLLLKWQIIISQFIAVCVRCSLRPINFYDHYIKFAIQRSWICNRTTINRRGHVLGFNLEAHTGSQARLHISFAPCHCPQNVKWHLPESRMISWCDFWLSLDFKIGREPIWQLRMNKNWVSFGESRSNWILCLCMSFDSATSSTLEI